MSGELVDMWVDQPLDQLQTGRQRRGVQIRTQARKPADPIRDTNPSTYREPFHFSALPTPRCIGETCHPKGRSGAKEASVPVS